ncbi:hypothetical protein BDP27DRAFT_1314638 [Rhodocollybia butyracea]|uniref:Uncharacterized protein n=1 Tax=Rhodocollybia butyracea TaxID=206335 RepID=A0A9P5UD57_9AGAR|nr:hypothetical protein BDP27DRAFT_1314638 [Rhodocollybia butyracea]
MRVSRSLLSYVIREIRPPANPPPAPPRRPHQHAYPIIMVAAPHFPSNVHPSRAKAFIRFSSETARDMVQKVLEAYPLIGLGHQELHRKILERWPDATEKEYLLPKPELFASDPSRPSPPRPKHPIRSMKYLKSVVLPEMEDIKQVHMVYIKKGPPDGTGLDIVKLKEDKAQSMSVKTEIQWPRHQNEQWRWRLNPDYVPKDLPDPTAETMIVAQSENNRTGRFHGMSRSQKRRAKIMDERLQLYRYGRKLA